MPKNNKFKNNKPYILYVLELEDNYWYVGITVNMETRYKQHCTGEGAAWTRIHMPIRISETRLTNTSNPRIAAKHEDMLTLDYAFQHGENRVRGGQYCKTINPRWPK